VDAQHRCLANLCAHFRHKARFDFSIFTKHSVRRRSPMSSSYHHNSALFCLEGKFAFSVLVKSGPGADIVLS